MKINDILTEAPPAPGQIAQRAQQRNAAVSPATPQAVPATAQATPTAPVTPAQPGGKISKFWQGLAKGIGFDDTAQAISNYNKKITPAVKPAQTGATAPDATQPATGPQSQVPSADQFAQKLKSDIDAFVNAGGGLGSPAVKRLLKDLWMQAGGVRAEGKQNKKKPV